jgi:hypothetical protein
MPRNFRDAINITRMMGFRYLWIDSLCIIQDSPEDWEMEAARMGDVYANASITIAAAVAQNSEAGILQTGDREEALFEIPFNEHAPAEDTLLVYPKDQGSGRHSDEECFVKLIFAEYPNGVLASRGWTLQERLLSRRMLYYGSKQLFWSCCENLQAADGANVDFESEIHIPRSPSAPLAPATLPAIKSGYMDDQQRLQLYDKWYGWLSDYTEWRKLTKPSDKLPALSGIVNYLARLTGDQCVAGVWLGDLCRGLIWQRTPYLDYKRAEPPREPSWSWVKFDCGVQFLGQHLKVLESAIRLVDYSIDVKGKNPTGEIHGAKIVLEAGIIEMDASHRGSLRRTKRGFRESIWDFEDISEKSGIWGSRTVLMPICKTIEVQSAPPPRHLRISIGGYQMSLPITKPKDVIQALVLREVDGRPNVFQRIGQVILDDIPDDYLEGEDDVEPKMERLVLTLI